VFRRRITELLERGWLAQQRRLRHSCASAMSDPAEWSLRERDV
jgi:hypothetical protein